MVLDRHVLALDVADFLEASTERSAKLRGAFRRAGGDESNDRHRRLLRVRRERPCCRAAEQRDERAAPHSITSSAMASRPGGMVRPSALAVLRLITNSNLVDCTTGKSAGFAPLRI